MKFFQIAAFSALVGIALGAAIKRDNPKIDVKITKFANEVCDGDGNEEELDYDECRNFDHPFKSFWYHDNKHILGHHDNYDSAACRVVVYAQEDCTGLRYSPGDYPSTKEKCWESVQWAANSAKVVCDG